MLKHVVVLSGNVMHRHLSSAAAKWCARPHLFAFPLCLPNPSLPSTRVRVPVVVQHRMHKSYMCRKSKRSGRVFLDMILEDKAGVSQRLVWHLCHCIFSLGHFLRGWCVLLVQASPRERCCLSVGRHDGSALRAPSVCDVARDACSHCASYLRRELRGDVLCSSSKLLARSVAPRSATRIFPAAHRAQFPASALRTLAKPFSSAAPKAAEERR